MARCCTLDSKIYKPLFILIYPKMFNYLKLELLSYDLEPNRSSYQ